MHITFVSYDAYPLLDADASGGIGGAEVRACTFARGLRERGRKEIDFVIGDRSGLKSKAGGFSVVPYRKHRRRGLAKLGASLAKRFTSLPAMDPFYRDLETNVLLCFGVRNDTASIVRAAKESGKRAIVFLTSDRNIEDANRYGRRNRGAYGEIGELCRYTLSEADRVVAQTPYQLEMLKRMEVDADLIRNPIECSRRFKVQPRRQPPTALWVGRADTFSKRADLCVELARRSPHVQFQMIMNNHDEKTFDAIRRTAPENVRIIERVPFEQIESFFAAAAVLVNTSAAEGFPNSFLQAAKYGKPVVSLQVDPGNMLSEYGCGVCVEGDLDQMSTEIDRLCNGPKRSDIADRARRYVIAYHDVVERSAELDQLLDETFSTGKLVYAA